MRASATESIAYKLMGIYAFIQAISLWSSIDNIYSFRNLSVWVGTAFYMLLAGWISSIVALILLGAILIGKSHRIAALPFQENEIESTSPLSELDILSIAFSILGVYFFLSAFRGFVVFFANFMPQVIRSDKVSLDHFWAQTLKYGWPNLLGTLVGLALGIWLFFGGPALARFWKRRQATQTNRSEA